MIGFVIVANQQVCLLDTPMSGYSYTSTLHKWFDTIVSFESQGTDKDDEPILRAITVIHWEFLTNFPRPTLKTGITLIR